jgi:hypothetical protein
VIDLALHNLGTAQLSTFRVTDPASGETFEVDVEPGTTMPATVSTTHDGDVVVAVVADGSDASISVTVACGGTMAPPLVCPEGSAAHNGACVASASAGLGPASAGSATVARQSSTFARQLPATGLGTASGGLWLGAVLVGFGTVASLASRRRHD